MDAELNTQIVVIMMYTSFTHVLMIAYVDKNDINKSLTFVDPLILYEIISFLYILDIHGRWTQYTNGGGHGVH